MPRSRWYTDQDPIADERRREEARQLREAHEAELVGASAQTKFRGAPHAIDATPARRRGAPKVDLRAQVGAEPREQRRLKELYRRASNELRQRHVAAVALENKATDIRKRQKRRKELKPQLTRSIENIDPARDLGSIPALGASIRKDMDRRSKQRGRVPATWIYA